MTKYSTDLGDSDPGSALRLSMSAAVSDIRMPADLLDRAASRNRKRNARKFLAGGVCAVAAVATVATVVAAAPGPSSGQPAARRQTAGLQAQTAAYVLNRAAAAQVNSYRMISVDQSAGGGVIYTDVATQQQRIVSSLLDSAGQPYFQIATAISGRAYWETDIEYQHHVYSTFTTSSMDHGVRVTLSSFLPLQTNHNPTIAFNKALTAGIIKVVGHRNLNGRDTILVTINSPYRSKARPARAVTGRNKGMAISVPPASSIWLDASNYLVVQTQHFVPHFPRNFRPSEAGSKTTWSPVIDHVTWLRPTGGNLGLLTLTPPAGFAKISYSELAQKYLGPIS
jgi:hypothetical protein